MVLANDPWEEWRPERPALPLDRMVHYSVDQQGESPEAFYGQAYAMLTFLLRLGDRSQQTGVQQLVAALREGDTTPDALFEWALRKWSGDSTLDAEVVWALYWEKKFGSQVRPARH